jgi:predicted RNase H-like HicB family nuclease
MKKRLTIHIEPPSHSSEAWGISVPGLEDCFSAADSKSDIKSNATEATLIRLKASGIGTDFEPPSADENSIEAPNLKYLRGIDVDLSSVIKS